MIATHSGASRTALNAPTVAWPRLAMAATFVSIAAVGIDLVRSPLGWAAFPICLLADFLIVAMYFECLVDRGPGRPHGIELLLVGALLMISIGVPAGLMARARPSSTFAPSAQPVPLPEAVHRAAPSVLSAPISRTTDSGPTFERPAVGATADKVAADRHLDKLEDALQRSRFGLRDAASLDLFEDAYDAMPAKLRDRVDIAALTEAREDVSHEQYDHAGNAYVRAFRGLRP